MWRGRCPARGGLAPLGGDDASPHVLVGAPGPRVTQAVYAALRSGRCCPAAAPAGRPARATLSRDGRHATTLAHDIVRAAAGTGGFHGPRRATRNQEINVPKSRGRTKAVYTPPPRTGKAKVSPRWLVPAMLGCLVVGLAWIALFYITSQSLPLPALGPWNLAIGFAFIIAGLGFATKWR